MKNVLRSLALLACVSLLLPQLSGLHRHVDAHGDHVGVHGTHVHHADSDGHDHSGDIDVALVEQLGFSDSKLIPLLFACAVFLAALTWAVRRARPPPTRSGRVRRRVRWRPPLRAPPIPA